MGKILLGIFIFASLTATAQYTASEIKKLRIKSITIEMAGSTQELHYDEHGNQVSWFMYGSLYRTMVHTYQNERLVYSVSYDSEGKIYDSTIYDYKKDGSCISTNIDAQFQLKEYTYYDKQGSIIKKIPPDGSERVYNYNANGKLIRILTTPKDGAVNVNVTFHYDKNGRLIREVSDGDFKWMNEYTYNGKGHILSKKTKALGDEKSESISRYTYTLRA